MSLAETGPQGLASPTHPVRIRRSADGGIPVLEIPEGFDYPALRAWLRSALPDQIEAIGGRAARLDLGGRAVVLFDLRRLVNLLREEFSIEVTGLYVDPDALWNYGERELRLKLFKREPADQLLLDDTDEVGPAIAVPSPDDAPSAEATTPPSDDEAPPEILLATVVESPLPEPLIPDDEAPTDSNTAAPSNARAIPGPRIETAVPDALEQLLGKDDGPGTRTLNVPKTLRSGASIRFDGDVIVMGDVNPGAEIVATGNILVLGALKGLAHAGAGGNEASFVLGFDLRPTQVRIGRRIAISPSMPGPASGAAGVFPTVARVADGAIVLEPYRTRPR
jgi:septum site-determining protein MinC